MSIADMCKQTILIEKPTRTVGNMGGLGATSWSTRTGSDGSALAGISASIQNQSGKIFAGKISEMFARQGITISHTAYTDTDISTCQINDRVTDQDGNYYIVRYVSDMAAQNRGWALYLDQIPPATA